MEIAIKDILVNDRIRKDLGAIQELAEDIRTNGLINPIVINSENRLLTGERRLEAVKLLGWSTVPVTVMKTRDEEHELSIEISENEARKEFSRAERADYMRRMLEVEKAKAKERQGERTDLENFPQNSAEGSGESREIVSKEFGISRDTLQKELFISDHQEDMAPEDFADWDEGRLSTNKAYQKLKAQLREAEEREDSVKKTLQEERVKSIRAESALQLAKADKAKLKERADELQEELDMAKAVIKARDAEPDEVVEKLVVPDDYEALKEAARRSEQEYLDLRERSMEKDRKIKELESQLGRDKLLADADRDVQAFTTYTLDYIRRYGGHVWAFEQIEHLSEPVRDEFMKAIKTLDAFAQQLIANLEGGAVI